MSGWHRQDLLAANRQIDRLVAENRRLNDKVDRLLKDLSEVREGLSEEAEERAALAVLLDEAIADRDLARASEAEMDEFLTAALEERDALLAEVAALKEQLAEEKPAHKRKGV